MISKLKIFNSKLFLIVVFCVINFAGCSSISGFNQHAYIQTTSLKVDALNIMSLAGEEYTIHKEEAKSVITNLEKLYEYEKNRPKNTITLKMWDKLKDPSGSLFIGFMKKWEREGKLKPAIINNSKEQVSEAFDRIAQLESKKIKK